MKKYKSLITSSLLLALIIATPVVSFADNNKDKNDNENKIEQSNKVKENEDKKESSWFGSNWFDNHKKDTVAPVITDLLVSSIKKNKATITWATDTESDSMVWISKTSPVDTSLEAYKSHDDQVLNHRIKIKKLESNTKYYVIVGGSNDIGMTKSSEISFTTPAEVVTPGPVVVDTNAPIISNIETTIGGSNVEISWKTNEATSSTIFYSKTTPVDTTTASAVKAVDNTLTKEHSLSIPNLTSNTLYHFILKSVDASNNVSTSSELSFVTN